MPVNPGQTASPLSRIFYNYLDPIVWHACHVTHMPLSDLPPLSDSDHSKFLVQRAFPHLDPLASQIQPKAKSTDRIELEERKTRSHFHTVLALLVVFRKEFGSVVLLILANNAALLFSPYGLRHLLMYLESGGEGAIVRPWVWIASVCPSGSILYAFHTTSYFRFSFCLTNGKVYSFSSRRLPPPCSCTSINSVSPV